MNPTDPPGTTVAESDLIADCWRRGEGADEWLGGREDLARNYLSRILRDPRRLRAHLQQLESLSGQPFSESPSRWCWGELPPPVRAGVFPHTECLPIEKAEKVAEEGLDVLSRSEVVALLLNPWALWDLAGLVGALLTDHWLPLLDKEWEPEVEAAAGPAAQPLRGPGPDGETGEPALPSDIDQEQRRFNRFIRAENERLNRLIRNLYLQFHLEHYSERDLYDRICQEVADYFRADGCSLYLVRYKPDDGKTDPPPADFPRRGDVSRLTKWLELVGAFGPWRRALRLQYVRQLSGNLYELPPALDKAGTDPASYAGLTRRAYFSQEPTRYASGYDFRGERQKDRRWREVTPHQVVWYQDGLYNCSRCIMFAPLVREGGAEGVGEGNRPPLHRHIGLIKVENRSPHAVPGYGEVEAGAEDNDLFFAETWRVAALRPYVRDLQAAADRKKNPYLPLHNNVGWHQYFDDHPLAAGYFQQLVRELRRRRRQGGAGTRDKLLAAYQELARWLESLVECLIRLEGWLQHLVHACRMLCGVGERPVPDRPVPSLFNVCNLRAAILQQQGEAPPSPAGEGGASRHVYGRLRTALFACLAGPDEAGRKRLERLETIFTLAAGLQQPPAGAGDSDSEPAPATPAAKELARLMADEPDGSALKRTLTHPGPAGGVHDPAEVRLAAGQEAEEIIERLARQRAADTLKALYGKEPEFQVPIALNGSCPKWNFGKVLEDVGDELSEVCARLGEPGLADRSESEYELRHEEDEVIRTAAEVKAVLGHGGDHGAPCTSVGGHRPESDESAGCRAARALAAATMYSDSFHPIDEKRLVFIASHIMQVLDNHLLNQAGQRRLNLEHDTLGLLGLELFGLDLLSALQSCFRRIVSALRYLVEREARRDTGDEVAVRLLSDPLEEFVRNLRVCLEDSPDHKDHKDPEVRTRVCELMGGNRGAAVLKDMERRATLHGCSVTLDVPSSAPPGTRLTFWPHPEGDRGDPDCWVVLRCNEREGKPDQIVLGVAVRRASVCRRDYQVLWRAARLFEEVLEVIQSCARGGQRNAAPRRPAGDGRDPEEGTEESSHA